MFTEYQNLEEIIDPTVPSVYSLAQRLHVDVKTMFQTLCADYCKAYKEGKIFSDSSGDSFRTDYAEIYLIPNNDFQSKYPGYLKYDTRGFAPAVFAEEQTDMIGNGAPELPETLDDDVCLNRDNLMRLNRFVVGVEEDPCEEILTRLKQSYIEAKKQNHLTPYKDSYSFPTGLLTSDGVPIIAAIKPNWGRVDYSWVLNYVGYDRNTSYASAIKQFALLGTYLSDISALAKPEKWFFGTNSDNLDILKNYIAYTFFRLQREKKICINEKGDFAAFNTGLASSTYDDIYMCFRKRQEQEGPAWKYAGACTAARDSLGKQLIQQFNPLPQPADYINFKEDVIYDVKKNLFLDSEHILIDHIERLPLEFLQFYLGSNEEACGCLRQIDGSQCENLPSAYTALRNVIRKDNMLFENLRTGLQGVVDTAKKRLRWNYRLAIPCYYPKNDSMSLLLPMYFFGREYPQAALVVQLTKSQNYFGHTLLPMDIAYMNARLISSQESSWLAA